MPPYRSPISQPAEPTEAPGEEWVLALLLVALGAVRVGVALARGEEIAVEVTAAALLGAIGASMLARLAR
jgi:hypothetical protein